MVRLVKSWGKLTNRGYSYVGRLFCLAEEGDLVAKRHLNEYGMILGRDSMLAAGVATASLPENMREYTRENGLKLKMGEIAFYLSSFNRHPF